MIPAGADPRTRIHGYAMQPPSAHRRAETKQLSPPNEPALVLTGVHNLTNPGQAL